MGDLGVVALMASVVWLGYWLDDFGAFGFLDGVRFGVMCFGFRCVFVGYELGFGCTFGFW